MIVFRYLCRQLLQATGAIALALLAVAMTGRFVQYLGDAVAGRALPDVLLPLMLYRIPEFLIVILPLSLLLGVVLVHGRMHAENEMVVLAGAGYGRRRILGFTLAAAAVVMLLTGFLSLHLAPAGIHRSEQLKRSQRELTEIDLIAPGRFQSFGGGERVTHAERVLGGAARELRNVFVAHSPAGRGPGAPPRVILAESARPAVDPATGARFMRLENVLRYDGEPGRADFAVARLDAQAILLPEPAGLEAEPEESALPTAALFGAAGPARRAELQWRLSAPLLVPVVALIAAALSRVSPRQGRYSRLVPATLVYVAYFLSLEYVRGRAADGALPAALGLWGAHLAFAAAGLAALRAGAGRA